MKVLAVNGSPRKTWNTGTLLAKALEGAAAQGAETEVVHLYDLLFKGCVSCFACKTRGGKSYGRCAVADDLAPVLEKVLTADALVFGSPIYFGTVTGEMRSFLERLFFPLLTYTDPPGSLFSRTLRVGAIYTLGATEEMSKQRGFEQHIALNEGVVKMIFGNGESLACYDTWQFDDYSKVVADRFDPAKKAQRRAEVFPEDCRKAYELGARLAGKTQ